MTYDQLIRASAAQLEQVGIETALLDARILMMHVACVDAAALIMQANDIPSKSIMAQFNAVVARRLRYEPVSQIIGYKEFWGLSFKVSKDVLTPRPDSEVIIEAALKLCADKPSQTILDIGTGSGCLLAALLSEFPKATGVGVDISPPALDIAAYNLRQLNLLDRAQLKKNHYADGLCQTFDLIISNPPYIPFADKSSLMPDVREYEPDIALFAEENGFAAYQHLCATCPAMLNSGGVLLFEVGDGQAKSVESLLKAGLKAHHIQGQVYHFHDLAGHVRVVGAKST